MTQYDEDDEEEGFDDEEDDEYEAYDEDDEEEDDEEYEVAEKRSLKPSGRLLKILGAVLALATLIGAGVYFYQPRRPASEIWPEYKKADDGIRSAAQTQKTNPQKISFFPLHEWVLRQVDAGNLATCSRHFVTVKAKAKTSARVAEFEVAACGLRIGTDEDWIAVPVDGPFAAAVADLLDLTISTTLIVEATIAQAIQDGGRLPFLSDQSIANNPKFKTGWGAEWNSWPQGKKDDFKRSPTVIESKNELLRGWMATKAVDSSKLSACDFKEVIWPVWGQTETPGQKRRFRPDIPGKNHRLEIYLPCLWPDGKEVQPFSAGHHEDTYFDYSHNIRLVKKTVRVDGTEVSFKDFFTSLEYGTEFGFDRIVDRDLPYLYETKSYGDQLKKLVEELK